MAAKLLVNGTSSIRCTACPWHLSKIGMSDLRASGAAVLHCLLRHPDEWQRQVALDNVEPPNVFERLDAYERELGADFTVLKGLALQRPGLIL